MEEHPDVIVIASGYQSKGADISEAQCIYNGLTALGIAPERILLEEQATSTSENFLNSLELLEQKLGSTPGKIGVLTNEFQLLRADMIARDCGLEPINIAAATTDTRAFMTYFVREIFMVWYDSLKLALT